VLLVDYRAGSKDLIDPLRRLGLPVEETDLAFGDIAFCGRGEGGAPVAIGIEHKRISDLIQSMTSGRLQGHQLLGMLDAYDRHYLIIEGDWDQDSQGRAVMFRGKGVRKPIHGAPPAIELEKRICTLEARGGFRLRYTTTRRGSIRTIIALYRFWTDKDLDLHRSHLAVHAPDLDRGLKIPISLKRQLAATLPDVGYIKSQAVDNYFPSIRAMFNASPEEWQKIEGIGKKIAKSLDEAFD
jgi:ERCC4-type nuclease